MPDQEKHYFLTILLTDKFLQSSLVSNNGQGTQIKEFSETRSYFDRRDLIDQLDKSLQQLGPESQDIVETVFAFDHDWLENGNLSDTKKPVVKEITEELSLDAVGQFSIPEALAEARLIGDQADSCLLTVLKEDSLDLIFLKHGQFLDLITTGRSDSIVDDFAELLARAAKNLTEEGQYFPSKLLLTSISLKQKELENLHSQLIKVDWTKNPGFTQAPTIVVLEHDYMIKSVSLSAGKVLSKENFLAKMPSISTATIASTATQVHVAQTPPVQTPITPEYAVENTTPQRSASSFGISFDQNYLTKSTHQNSPAAKANSELMVEPDLDKQKSVKARSPFGRFYLSHRKIILLGVGAGLLGLLTLFMIFAFFISKVKILVTPEQTLLHKTVAITLDPNIDNSDFEKVLLKASLQNKEISGQDVTETTGIGLVGDKAKGKVLIYNKSAEEKELKEGTIISNNGIEFFTDSAVKIAAAKEKSGGSGVDYGSAEVMVTAKDIGAEANFNKETKFRVADYFEDKFSAVAVDTFAGGSSREVRVVAEVDMNRLTETLKKKLTQEAMKEFNQDSKDGINLVPSGKTKIIKNDFSAKLGDETESLTLNLTLEVEAVKYLSADLKQLGAALLKNELPTGYSFVGDPSLLSDKAQAASDSSRIKLSADLSARATADLKLDELKRNILGKNWSEAVEYLENDSEIKAAQVSFQPPFLINVLRKLPNDEARIIFEVVNLEDK